jgi:hypothetical protein
LADYFLVGCFWAIKVGKNANDGLLVLFLGESAGLELLLDLDLSNFLLFWLGLISNV